MELTGRDVDGGSRKASRPLRHDVGRAYAGIASGLLLSVALEVLLQADAWVTSLTIYLGPVALLALLLGYNAAPTGLFVARLAGATGGYLATWGVARAAFPYVYQMGGSAMVLITLPAVGALFVATGMVSLNRLWVRVSGT